MRVSTRTEFGIWVIRLSICVILISLLLLPSVVCPLRQHSAINTEEKMDYLKKKKARNKSTWSNAFRKLRMVLPYVWPKGNYPKQGLVCICMVLLGLGRVVNLLVPLVSRDIVDSLAVKVYEKLEFEAIGDNVSSTSLSQTSLEKGQATYSFLDSGAGTSDSKEELVEILPVFCWSQILLYCFLMFLKGGGAGSSGLLNNLRSFCWVPVQHYTSKTIQLSLFHHLHSLSLRWHLHRQTGEVLKIVDRGTNSINILL
ncbi:ATP-binding cassette sub-family B member 6-like, partial [Ylistrum balloti]|uniref:ATP-binding cassette sub-family B member 6-like n=1 Tax=Ylistrum balloti TaxID=509963 RepID=UPI002905F35C